MTEQTPDPARGAEVLAMDRAHVFHSWSAQRALKPLVIARAEGSCFWDYDGRRYLDFSSQLVNVNIGHQHPRVTAAIAEQPAVLFVDLPGGSCLTSSIRLAKGKTNVAVVTGVNLAMLLDFVFHRDLPPLEAARRAAEAGSKAIRTPAA